MIRKDFLKRLGILHRTRLMSAIAGAILMKVSLLAAALALFSLTDIVFPMSFRIRMSVLIFLAVYILIKLFLELLEIMSI